MLFKTMYKGTQIEGICTQFYLAVMQAASCSEQADDGSLSEEPLGSLISSGFLIAHSVCGLQVGM
jgi:hypothetical protein